MLTTEPGPNRRSVLRGIALAGGALAVPGVTAGCGTGVAGVPAEPIDAPATSLDPYFPCQGSGGYLVNHYALDLAYSQNTGRIASTVTMRILPFTALRSLSLNLSGNLQVISVKVNGANAVFTRSQMDDLRIGIKPALRSGRMATLEIAYSGQPQPVVLDGVGTTGWQALCAAAPDSAATETGVSVLSLPIGAPTWFPCADHPTLKAAYDISVTVPNGLSVLANGRLIGKAPQNFGTKWTYHHDGPIASYLATVQIGTFDLHTSNGPKGVQLRNAYPRQLAAAAAHDLARQDQMITTFADLFGPYPFDVFGTAALDNLPVQQAGAQTIGLVNSSVIDGTRTSEHLIARGLALQWFGASVSLASWRDIWLSTAFATYAEWLWSEKSGGARADIQARAAMRQLALLPQNLVLADPGAQRIVDQRISLRGACFLHALRVTMGDPDFFELLRVWCNRNQSGFAQTADFIALVPNVYSQQDLTALMNSWALTAALPELPAA
jgi:aminopeptidase N